MDDSMMIDSVFSKYSGGYTSSQDVNPRETDGNYLNFDSYLKLMVAQMQNQDFNDPMKDSEVLAQMAQYSMLEGIKNMTQQSAVSYATSLVGKAVTVNNNGSLLTGVVESISVSNGEPWLMIDGVPYKSNSVTDVIAQETYDMVKSVIGKTVKYKSQDAEGNAVEAAGRITDSIVTGGDTIFVIDGKKQIALSDIIEVVKEVQENSADNKKTEEDGSDDDGETVLETKTAVASENMTYAAKSQSLIETFMKELDEASGVSSASSLENETEAKAIAQEYTVETFEFEAPDFGAQFFGGEETYISDLTGVDNTYGSLDENYSSSPISTYSDTPVTSTYSASSGDIKLGTARDSSGAAVKGVTTSAGVSKADCVPHRISVEKYPEEAALADQLGTRMYDIRWINNHAITSRIKTGPVIGHSSKGRAVTEVGYSGVGQLGEVVTFADGHQRVEILLRNGHSTWLETSGNLTLDEICTREYAPGSLAGRLTPEEGAIRHFSHPMEGIGEDLKYAFKQQLLMYGV